MDLIPFISKNTTFPPLPARYNGNFAAYYASGQHLHHYLQAMNREVLSKFDIMTFGDGAGVQVEDALEFMDEVRKELQTLFHFDHTDYGRRKDNYRYPNAGNRHFPDLKAVFTKWDSVFYQSHMVSCFGNASVYREPSSKMLFTFLLSMRATPCLYNGDEIGTTNVRF